MKKSASRGFKGSLRNFRFFRLFLRVFSDILRFLGNRDSLGHFLGNLRCLRVPYYTSVFPSLNCPNSSEYLKILKNRIGRFGIFGLDPRLEVVPS